MMGTFHFVKSDLASFSGPQSSVLQYKFCFGFYENQLYNNNARSKRLNLVATTRRLPRTSCKIGGSENRSNGEEAPESLFMKELRRRGMTPTSLLDETKSKQVEVSFEQRDVAAVPENAALNQREQSMALNSEGLEGLFPRARVLLTLGGTFFLAFWPLILLTVASFLALYLYSGPKFVHDGSDYGSLLPQYIDPYGLVEEKRIAQTDFPTD